MQESATKKKERDREREKNILDIAHHVYLTWLAGKAPTKRRAYKFPTIFSYLNGEIVRDWRWLRWIWAARALLPAAGLNLAKTRRQVGTEGEEEKS